MSEPKLTVGRVETWRPIDYREEIYVAGDSPANFVLRLTAAINKRMAELFPPAPQPEAKAEPDDRVRAAIARLCAAAAAGLSNERWMDAEDDASVIEALIAELVRERDEARTHAVEARIRENEAESRLASTRDSLANDAYEQGRRNGEAAGYAKGAAVAKEACAKAVEVKADAENPFAFSVARMFARTIRETEVPDA